MEQTQICTKCGEEKPFSEFYKRKDTKKGIRKECITCILEAQKKDRMNDPERFKETQRKYRHNNPESIKNSRNKHYVKNRETINLKNQEWKQNNADEYNKSCVDYREKNREEIRERENKRNKEKYQTDPMYRLYVCISSNMYQSLKEKKGGRKWETLVDYTLQVLYDHIESLFEDWMTWDNRGIYDPNRRTWHLDHIRPVASFTFNPYLDPSEDPAFQECWALDNLQPLEAIENLRKGKKYNFDK